MDSYELRKIAETLANDCDGKKKEGLLAAADELDRLKKVEEKKKSYRPDGSFLRMG